MDSNKTYKAVFESAPDATIVTDEMGEIIMANNQVEKLLGYTKDELIGKKVEHLVPDQLIKKHSAYRNNYTLKPTVREMGAGLELQAKRKDGTVFPVDISLSPIKIDNQVLVSAAIRDVTEQKELIAQLRETMITLRSTNKELEQFTYVASHDLQEPLRTVINFVQLLKKQYEGKLDKTADRYLQYIKEASSRMSLLVQELSEYSRIGIQKQLRKVNCNQLVDEVKSDLEITLKESNAVVNYNSLPEINAYVVEMRQLFQNLISNAVKFRKKGADPVINIYAEKNNGQWMFAVSDNGIGIEKKYHDRIFVIFQRLHNRSEYDGTGIGLTNCKKIVELHGGRIWVESEQGKGSTFYFTIPEL